MKLFDPCRLCGSREFAFGNVGGGGHPTTFFVKDRGFIAALKGDKKSKIKARVCISCKNVQLFAPDIDYEDRTDPATI